MTRWTQDRPFLALIAVLVIVAVAMPVLEPSRYLTNAIGQLAAFAVLALSLDLIWGYLGILSLGHGLFFAIGGYVIAMHLLKHSFEVTGTVPDFLQFMGWKDFPFYWAGFGSFPYALIVAIAVTTLDRRRVRLCVVPLAGRRRLFRHHHPGAGLCRHAADVPQRHRLRRQ